MPGILTFGEVLWDVYEKESFIGGAGLNFAAHSARNGAESFLFSGVGKDEFGKKTREVISGFGIDSTFVKDTDKLTGKCIVKLNAEKIPTYNVLKDTAYDNIEISSDDISLIKKMEFDALYFGTLIQRNSVSRYSLKRLCEECNFKEIVCDINLRKDCYDEESVKFCFHNATVLKVSEEEEVLLKNFSFYPDFEVPLEDKAKLISEKFPQIKFIIFTLGENGSLIYSRENNECFKVNAQSVKVMSTVGAGDSFMATWITSYLKGNSPKSSSELASKVSGFVVSKIEAVPDYEVIDGNICMH